MTIYYSNLYDLNPYRGQATYSARAAQAYQRSNDIAPFVTFNIPAGTILNTGDIIKLLPGTPAGFRCTRCTWTFPGYDGGAALVANMGWMGMGNIALAVITSASIRTGGQYALTDAQLIPPASILVTDGAITSGAANLVCATSKPFIAVGPMIGQPISVSGAGVGGATLNTTISAIGSTSSITLAANASTTVTNATVSMANTGITSSGPVTAQFSQLLPGNNDELVIYVTTGAASAGTNGLAYGFIEGVYP